MSIGTNRTSMAIKICCADPEYHIMRDREANTAVSSLAITLPQASNGESINVINPRYNDFVNRQSKNV
jgi:hypothetical protein